MKSVKTGNDVRNIEIPVSRLGVPFSTWDELINLKLYAVERKRKNYSVVPSTVLKEEGQLVLYFESKDLTAIGVYDFLMTFSIVDPINPSGFQHKSISIESLFAIVETTAQEKDSGDEFEIDLNYAVDGHSYYQIWSQYYDGTEEDMIAWHRQPAVDASASVTQLGILIASAESAREAAEGLRVTAEQARATAEGLRVTAEESRATAEGLRVTGEINRSLAEQARVTAEGLRVTAEESRATAEGLRVTAEQARATAEGLRVTAEESRATAEGLRVTAEESRATAEGLRVTAEQARATAEDLRAQAETSRNVTSNLYNVTVQVPLPAGQFYTSTTARAAVPAGVRKIGLRITFSTGAMVWEEEQYIGTTTAGWAVSSNWVNTFASLAETWVGVVIDPNLSSSEPSPRSTVASYRATELQRTGNLMYHKMGKSRIFNSIYPAIVVRSTRKVAWRLDKNDFSKKDDGSVSVPDWTIHNICIVIPQLWRRIVLLDGVDTGRYEVRYDIAPFEGAEVFCNETAHSIGFASMDRTTTQLVSVISNDVRFRGGNNTSTNDANPWNWNSFLGKPATVISRTGFENNAAAAGWETGNIWDRTLWQQLMWLYFANTNIQLAYTSVLTAEGYPQGGLGAGVTSWSSFRWNAKNGYYPINTVGAGSLSVGCKVGVRDMVDDRYYIGQATGVAANSIVATSHFSTANGWSASYIGLTVQNMTTLAEATIVSKTDDSTLVLSADIFPTSGQWFWIKGVNYSYQIPVFFGIEHLYGELWDWVSGINIEKQAVAEGAVSRAFVCKEFSKRSATITADYRLVGLVPRTDGYIKTLYPELNIARINTASSSTTFISDYAYMSVFPSSGVGVYGCLFSGLAHYGGAAGSGYVSAHYAPSNTTTYVGSRLRAEIVV